MKTLKEIMEDKINKDNIYNNVVNINDNKGNNLWHYAAIVASGFLIVISILYLTNNFSIRNFTNNKSVSEDIINVNTIDDYQSIINREYNTQSQKISADDLDITKLYILTDCSDTLDTIDYNQSNQSNILNIDSWSIPKDILNREYNAIYVSSASEKYDTLYKYNINFYNGDNSKIINVFISRDSSCLRKYEKINDIEDSYINSYSVKIIKENTRYISVFTYQNYIYEIETNNLKEKDLIALLKSILQAYDKGNKRIIAKVNNILYISTNRESNTKYRCGTPDGYLKYNGHDNLPTDDNEINLKGEYMYQNVNNGIDVYINNKWIFFEKYEEKEKM